MTAAAPRRLLDDINAEIKLETDKRRAAVAAMQSYKLNDVSVFSTEPADLALQAAQEAHALCLVLGASVDEMYDPKTDEISLRPQHLARCFDAVATLIALSQFAGEAVER